MKLDGYLEEEKALKKHKAILQRITEEEIGSFSIKWAQERSVRNPEQKELNKKYHKNFTLHM